ncbi:helix-turn-helix transcriptional regulator [Sphaerisporangium melleum]|uniref:Helix-turn-helix transcriptional regulator n=1 Tax=Sphaerisporangium melleum TaxID=321316 RepID=A0A917VG48_9ACTN|nr:LuxR family transcriptional regulator [Sphaerisporangium melleum]GGK71638.1 helix-turn-helix transcriptional regulator [Sphaerisporangium melleum]GII70146.1 helix-turn-helix transcriptional regulator [Sphaerisporangium melleum]
MRFVARMAELDEIGRLTESAAKGRGGAVLVLGEAGIGKSALIEAAMGTLGTWLILRADGTEFERELPYAAVHQMCAPVLEHRAALPEPQRLALESVFGLGPGVASSPLLFHLAVLSLLNELARQRPVLCVVDDAQWIDASSRQVLTFVARRIAAERIAMVFAARDAGTVSDLADLPHLPLAGLSDSDARTLLSATVSHKLDDEVLDRLLAESHGNPLALVEFAHEIGPLGLPDVRDRPRTGVVDTLEAQFVRRLRGLSPQARSLVVLAAAEPVGDLGLLGRAARILGQDPADLAAAEDADLVVLGPRLRFRHPLVRAAAYGSATAGERRRAHAALAEATDPRIDPDRRAWHRAHAVADGDEDAAAELERSADRARHRGGFAAAAAFLERAGHLTPDPARQGGRLLAAAKLRLQAGAPAESRELVRQAERRPLDARDRVTGRLLRARIDFHVARSPEATSALVDAAVDLEPDLARETYLEAFASFMFNDNLPGRLRRLAVRVREQAPRRHPARPVDLLLDALLDQVLLPAREAVPSMRRAVAAFREASASPTASPWWMELVCQMAMDLSDAEAMEELANRQVELARRQGAFALLPQALRYQAIAGTALGRFDDADASLGEARAVDEAAGTAGLAGAELVLTTWRGDADRYRELQETLRSRVGPFELVAEFYATAVLRNGLGDYAAALDAALAAQRRQQAGSYVIWHLDGELVEAAARTGRHDEAAMAMERIDAVARMHPTPWAIATRQRARALLASGAEAEALYRDAVERLAESAVRVFHARARLTFGEWLRREGRRAEARVELRAAHEMLSAIGSRAFADRAARELLATGERPRRDGTNPLDELTGQERLIAGKVAAGATSKEVAATLFLSPRTIDAHLRNTYRKLDISSRRQLRTFFS